MKIVPLQNMTHIIWFSFRLVLAIIDFLISVLSTFYNCRVLYFHWSLYDFSSRALHFKPSCLLSIHCKLFMLHIFHPYCASNYLWAIFFLFQHPHSVWWLLYSIGELILSWDRFSIAFEFSTRALHVIAKLFTLSQTIHIAFTV